MRITSKSHWSMDHKRSVTASLEDVLLTSLPNEVLSCIFATLPAADQWRLAGTCRLLRTLVLDQAERITVQVGAVSSSGSRTVGVSEPLLKAVRRQHGELCLRLKSAMPPGLQQQGNNMPSHNARGGSHQAAGVCCCSSKWLKALGQCPAVDKLELEGLAVSNSQFQLSFIGPPCCLPPAVNEDFKGFQRISKDFFNTGTQ
jgi:hypothetical protein